MRLIFTHTQAESSASKGQFPFNIFGGQSPGVVRKNQLNQIASTLGGSLLPTIICGDFNLDNEELKWLGEIFPAYLDTGKDAGNSYNPIVNTMAFADAGLYDPSRYDVLLASRADFVVLEARLLKDWKWKGAYFRPKLSATKILVDDLSDHFPLLVTLEF